MTFFGGAARVTTPAGCWRSYRTMLEPDSSVRPPSVAPTDGHGDGGGDQRHPGVPAGRAPGAWFQPDARRCLRSAFGGILEGPPEGDLQFFGHRTLPFVTDGRQVVRSFSSARDAWLRTVPREMPSTSAISASVSDS